MRARAIEPNTRVMITRRCHDRRMFLSPFGDPKKGHTPEQTANYYGYTVARAVRKYGVSFHGGIQMGNHHHQNITDRLGNRPNYKNSVHGNLARGINARFGRFDGLWSSGGSCDTVTPSDDDTLKDLAYSDCNPTTAGLVKWGHLWPGFSTYGWRFGETRIFTRPHWYYDPKQADNPEIIELTRTRPDIFPELSDDELSDKLIELCREIELKRQAEMKAGSRRFMGLRKLAKTHWWRRAKSPEKRFGIVPTVASSQAGKRKAELRKNEAWRRDYAAQRDNYRSGAPAKFPAGSYFLPKIYKADVEPP
ncbi:MAG: hypothetical protein KUG77_00710 [Nannocystaceae bacterium]|nr:hypothetical protein [Nannocystaceae bacterium]